MPQFVQEQWRPRGHVRREKYPPMQRDRRDGRPAKRQSPDARRQASTSET
jgi:hypothetical protein